MIDLRLGDCLEIMKELPDNSVDAVVTDPPYCSGGRQQAGARNTIAKNTREDEAWLPSDNMGTDTYLWFMRQVAKESIRLTVTGGSAYVFTDWRQYTTIVTAWESAGWTLKNVLVWDKNRGGAMGSWWRNNHEWVPIFVKGKARPLTSHSFFNTWAGGKPQGGQHPTEKPLELLQYIISAVTPVGGVILDPFMGSGTAGVAAISLGYGFQGIEIDPTYYAIAEKRIADAQQQLALPLAVET